MAQASPPRPNFDPAYQFSAGVPPFDCAIDLNKIRDSNVFTVDTAESIHEGHQHIRHTEHTVPPESGLGVSSVPMAFFEHKGSTKKNRSVLYFVHGGGQIMGNRFSGVEALINFFPNDEDIVVASIEYRLAPESPAPASAYDCYAGLIYLVDHAAELDIDPTKIIIIGTSGGAGIAAATVLLARERQRSLVCAQILNIPMLDDRVHFVSAGQFQSNTLWDGRANEQAWTMILGSDKECVDEIRCPGRATNFSGLPSTFIDVGECEVFRDSAVAFASQIWKDGGSAELHVWPGVYHAAMYFEPSVPVSQAQDAALKNFIRRTLEKSVDIQY